MSIPTTVVEQHQRIEGWRRDLRRKHKAAKLRRRAARLDQKRGAKPKRKGRKNRNQRAVKDPAAAPASTPGRMQPRAQAPSRSATRREPQGAESYPEDLDLAQPDFIEDEGSEDFFEEFEDDAFFEVDAFAGDIEYGAIQAALAGAQNRLRRLRRRQQDGSLSAARARQQGEEVYSTSQRSMRRFQAGRPRRRQAVRAALQERMSQNAFAGAPERVAALSELASAEYAGELVMSDLSAAGVELGFIKAVGRGIKNAVQKFKDNAPERQARRAARREKRQDRKADKAEKFLNEQSYRKGGMDLSRGGGGAWGPLTDVGSGLKMKSAAGQRGVVLELHPNLFLVTKINESAVQSMSPAFIQQAMLNDGARAIQARQHTLAGVPVVRGRVHPEISGCACNQHKGQ